MQKVGAPLRGAEGEAGAHGAPGLRSVLLGALVLSLVVASVAVATTGRARAGHVHPTTAAPAAAHALLPPPAIENPSWSGELAWPSEGAVTGFDRVTGAWAQPSVVASSNVEYADTWVGVDGYDGKLLQAGTTAWSSDGTVGYVAWFVAWTGAPSGMTVIDEPVSAGDRMRVVIDRNASETWSVGLDDVTAGWTWSTTVTYPARGSSAEWIEEAPGTWSTPSQYQTLADYGSTTFTTVSVDGAAPSAVTAFDVVQDGAVVSYPSAYDESQGSFTVHYGAPVPVVPAAGPSS